MTVTKEDVMIAVEAARDKKALDPVLLEVSEVSTYADYFFICSGRSVIQVKALVSAIEQALKERGILPLHVEGLSEGRWVLLDYDELIIHIFLEETRTFYNLERLWNDVPHTSFADDSAPAEASVLSHGD
ncbi:ribosome silencing factor [candidate division KSB3 bacterium]|uniref:Ribosomal silencing factor RsfS n=1 Tax=candidate division KSB3 bacterium TaxID=2044937 RepID=A0A2G6KC33_9BACT|nr:MAG: ribosome silencing factor [candidate division KSB3 bacterium]